MRIKENADIVAVMRENVSKVLWQSVLSLFFILVN
jgi:hypothetical protein